METGDIIIAEDGIVGDRYVARVLCPSVLDVRQTDPVVEILSILRWPIQHSAHDPGIPQENPPFMRGDLAQLTCLRMASAEEAALLPCEAWVHALGAARETNQESIEILERHRHGRIRANDRMPHVERSLWLWKSITSKRIGSSADSPPSRG